MSGNNIAYSSDTRVTVYPFVRQPQGEEIVIGRVETGTFLALPPEALEVLDDLAAGKSIGEAQDLYNKRHGEIPDVADLIDYLGTKGLVKPKRADGEADGVEESGSTAQTRYHFQGFPQNLAQRIFGPAALLCAGMIVALGLLAAIWQPDVIPGPEAVYFAEDRALKILILSLFSYGTLFLHEMAHLVAGRALGVKSRIGIGRRMWVLVAETDLSGLWAVPKEKRYLPLVAGPILDAVSGSLLILFLVASPRLSMRPPAVVLELLRAMLFVYLMRLLWQLFFFVRTDFYYVFATYFDCKNLMQDVKQRIKNKLSRFFPRVSHRDQSTIPERERRVIGYYAYFWLAGRTLALSVFFTVSVPVTAKYLGGITATFRDGYRAAPYAFLDALAVTVFSLIPLGAGVALWIRSFAARRRSP